VALDIAYVDCYYQSPMQNIHIDLMLFRLTPICLLHHQAESSGKFSNEELLNLKREFQHHKDKIHEYNILMDTVSRTEGELIPSLFHTTSA